MLAPVAFLQMTVAGPPRGDRLKLLALANFIGQSTAGTTGHLGKHGRCSREEASIRGSVTEESRSPSSRAKSLLTHQGLGRAGLS